MAKGFSNTKPMGEKPPRMEELVGVYEIPDKEWVTVRFLDREILAVAQHWIDIRKRDGGETRFPKLCLSWNPETEQHDEDVHCPYCEAGISTAVTYYANAIIREEQEREPTKKAEPLPAEAKSGFKDKASRAWTPVKVVRLTATFVSQIKDLTEINSHNVEGKKVKYDVSDNKFGMDVQLRINPDKKGQGKYTVSAGDKTPLSKEERRYLVWNLSADLIKRMGLESESRARQELARIPMVGKKKSSDDYDVSDGDDEVLNRRPKNRGHDYDDYDEPPPKKAKKRDDYDDYDAPPPKRKKPVEEDYYDDEPPKKAKKKTVEEYEDYDDEPPKKAKKKVVEEDYDDEPPKKAKKKVVEDYDDYDADDYDEPKPKKKR